MLTSFPRDILKEIISWLSIESVYQLNMTCKAFNQFIFDNLKSFKFDPETELILKLRSKKESSKAKS